MKSFDEYLRDAEVAHGHLCAGQVLGVRMAMLGLQKLGIDDPRGKDRKRLVTFVEIDRCATDAVGVVTGCRLGKRALKFRDWGKMAATFVDAAAIRPCDSRPAKESSKHWRARCIPKSKTRTSSRCSPTAKWRKTICSRAVGEGRPSPRRISRIQRRAHRVRRVRRRHQLPP